MRGRVNDRVTRELMQEISMESRRLTKWVDDAMARLTPTQHGHVVPLPDGKRAKCGGVGGCEYCKDEQDRHDLDLLAKLLEQNGLKRVAGLEGLLQKLGVDI
jgi:hypothetical protein